MTKYNKKTYQQNKEKARCKAIQWQFTPAYIDWLEYSETVAYFEKLAKRYGLLKEFKANGII